MRCSALMLCVALGGLIGWPERAWGQTAYANVHGTFGDRALGQSLSPRPRTFGSGIVTGWSGEFLGRGRTEGMLFPRSPWQYPVGVIRFPEVTPRSFADAVPWGLVPRELAARPEDAMPQANQPTQTPTATPPKEVPPPTEAQPQPEAPAQPEQWFRAPAPAGETNAPSLPAVAPQTTEGARSAPQPRNVAIGFVSAPSASGPAANAAEVIRRSTQIRKLSPISVTMQDETAVLRGRVASERDRKLAELLVQFEPGIWRVRNELTVAQPERASAAPATARRE